MKGINLNKRQIGSFYEEMACEFLREQGIFILEQNFRCKQGEVDIIGEDRGTLLFVEVKYRKNAVVGFPYEAVTYQKQKSISSVASYYKYRKQINKGIRYDIISICGDKIHWIQNAFNHIGYIW